MSKHHGIDMAVETAAALSLTVYGMISAARQRQQSPQNPRRVPPPAEEIPPAAPYAPVPHPDPFSKHLHRQHRPDTWATDEHDRNKNIADLDPQLLAAELCADHPHKYVRDIIGYGVHSVEAYESAYLMYKQLVNSCTLVNITVDHTKLGQDYLAYFSATYVSDGREINVEAQGRRQRAPAPRQRQYTNAEQEAVVLLMLKVERSRQQHRGARTDAERIRHDKVCASTETLQLGHKVVHGVYRNQYVAKFSKVDSNGNRVPATSHAIMHNFSVMLTPYIARLGLNQEETYTVVGAGVVSALSEVNALSTVLSRGVGRDLDGMPMSSNRPMLALSREASNPLTRKPGDFAVFAQGTPRRFFQKLASQTPELTRCFHAAMTVPGTSRQGDELIQQVQLCRKSDPLHFPNVGNLSEVHTGLKRDVWVTLGGAPGSDSDSDDNVRSSSIRANLHDDVPDHDHDTGSSSDPVPATLRGMRNIPMTYLNKRFRLPGADQRHIEGVPLANFLSGSAPNLVHEVQSLDRDEYREYPHHHAAIYHACIVCEKKATNEYQVFCSDNCAHISIRSFEEFVRNVPPTLKALHDRIEPATQFPDMAANPLWFSGAVRQVQGTYPILGTKEDIWEKEMSNGMWQVVLDVWLKHAIGLDIPIDRLSEMFSPPNEGPQNYSQNVYTLMWSVVGNQEFDNHVKASHERVQLLSRLLQSKLARVYSFDKNEFVSNVADGKSISAEVISKSGELQAMVERLVRAGNQTVNVAALMASIIQAQRDYATRKEFQSFEESQRLQEENTKLRFEQQTAKAHLDNKFVDDCGKWRLATENLLRQSNRQQTRMHQKSKVLEDENDRLWGMYQGLREQFNQLQAQSGKSCEPTNSGSGKRSRTTDTQDLSDFQRAFINNIDNQ